MDIEAEYILFLYGSTRIAMRAERTLKEHGIFVRLLPTPGTLQVGCGFALRTSEEDAEAACRYLEEVGCSASKIFAAIFHDGLRMKYENVTALFADEAK